MKAIGVTQWEPSESAWLVLLCFNRFAASLSFMMYAGTLAVVAAAWGMTASEAGSIQTAFNLCYALSLVVTSWLADRIGAKRVFQVSSWLTAAGAIVFALFAHSYWSGLVLFVILGLVQGGTYGPSIMLVAQGVPARRRGAAVGWLIAAASLGYFGSISLTGTLTSNFGYRIAFLACGIGPVIGAIASQIGLRRKPNFVAPKTVRRSSLLSFLTDRRSLLLTIGYTAHCWELLGMWAWMPAFLTAALAGYKHISVHGLIIAAVIHLSGFAASVSTGIASDRVGRRLVLITLAAAGALCSFIIGWTMSQTMFVLLPLAALYGFTVVGDSGVLSTAMTESVDTGSLGTALAVRSILGFGAGGLAPLAFGLVLDTTPGPSGWGWAFASLGIGGAVATLCAVFLAADRPARPMRPTISESAT